MVIGNEKKHLIIKFISMSAAETFRGEIIEINKKLNAAKKTPIQFTRLKMNIPNVDNAHKLGTKVLLMAKRHEMIKSFYMTPKLSADKLSIVFTTGIRRGGDGLFENVSWSTQTLDQAKNDLLTHLKPEESENLRAFHKSLAPPPVTRNGDSSDQPPPKSTLRRTKKK